jgi:hypothetical protein
LSATEVATSAVFDIKEGRNIHAQFYVIKRSNGTYAFVQGAKKYLAIEGTALETMKLGRSLARAGVVLTGMGGAIDAFKDYNNNPDDPRGLRVLHAVSIGAASAGGGWAGAALVGGYVASICQFSTCGGPLASTLVIGAGAIIGGIFGQWFAKETVQQIYLS